MKRKSTWLGLASAMAFTMATAAQAADKVNVLLLPFLSQAPIFIAMEEGYFADQGIEVVPAKFTGFASIVPGLMSNHFDMAMMSTTPGFFNSIAKGAKGRVVAPAIVLTEGKCEYVSYYGRKGVDWDSLKKGEKLEVLVSAEPASVNTFLADQIVKQDGASGFSYKVKLLPPHVEMDGLQSESVDMVSTSEPWITRFDRASLGQTVYGGSELSKNMHYSNLLFSPRLVSEDPELGQRMLKAISAGVAQYNKGKTDRNIEILEKHTKLDVQTIKDACWADIPESSDLNEANVDELQDWYIAQGFQDRKLTLDEYFHRY